MTLPPLPKPAAHIEKLEGYDGIGNAHYSHTPAYTEAQLLAYRDAVVEACAKVCEAQVFNMFPLADCAREDCADAIRSMTK
jgi:hypothetical protein